MSTEISVAVRRAVIETNLEQCRDRVTSSFVEMGRWLNRAKDERVVDHGQWTAWVQAHAGLSERGAQRCMQIAREVPEGSLLEGLGMTKVRALMALPAGEREEAARDMDAAHLSGSEVEARVRAMRAERDEALRVVGAQRNKMDKMRRGREQAVDAAVQEAIRREREDAEQKRKRAVEQAKARAENEYLANYRRVSDNLATERNTSDQLRKMLDEATGERVRLEEQLRIERANVGVSAIAQARLDEQQAEIEQLKKNLSARDREIDSLTDALDEAQTQAARGDMTRESRRDPRSMITSSIGALMAEAGKAPGELERMQGGLDEDMRHLLIGQAKMLGQWAMRIIAICGGELDD